MFTKDEVLAFMRTLPQDAKNPRYVWVQGFERKPEEQEYQPVTDGATHKDGSPFGSCQYVDPNIKADTASCIAGQVFGRFTHGPDAANDRPGSRPPPHLPPIGSWP